MQNPRDLVKISIKTKKKNGYEIEEKRYDIDENLLDIYQYYDKPINDWSPPATNFKSFSELKQLYFDIETHSDIKEPKAALDPNKARITLIGLINEQGTRYIINAERIGETQAILEFYRVLKQMKPDILAGFNCFSFDLPFIERRAQILGLRSPFWVSERETTFRTATRNNVPVQYKAFWLERGAVSIIDLYHQALAWDYVNRTLVDFTLKKIPVQLGLREESDRLVLTHEQMIECIETGDMATLIEYLRDDLEDTLALGRYLIPDIYYQKLIIPDWSIQSLSTGGNGSKWNDILLKDYTQRNPNFSIEPDDKVSFEGGLVGSYAGLYQCVSKIDVESLYPSVMLNYGVYSYKDNEVLMLAILKYLKSERVRLKRLAKDKKGTPEGIEANRQQSSLKVLINSGYGALGTVSKEFNDYVAASLVTGYGRAILRKMISVCKEEGGIIINYDTDGLYYASESFERNKQIHEAIQAKMPKGIFIEYELEAKGFYVPPSTKDEKEVDDDDEDMILKYRKKGLRKNYVIVSRKDKLKANGKYRKRDKIELEKEFIPTLVQKYLESPEAAKQYYKDVVSQLMLKTYPTKKLAVTRKISANEVALVEQGIGVKGESVTYWVGKDISRYGKKGQVLKTTKKGYTKDPKEINWYYYLQLVNEMWSEFDSVEKF